VFFSRLELTQCADRAARQQGPASLVNNTPRSLTERYAGLLAERTIGAWDQFHACITRSARLIQIEVLADLFALGKIGTVAQRHGDAERGVPLETPMESWTSQARVLVARFPHPRVSTASMSAARWSGRNGRPVVSRSRHLSTPLDASATF